MYDIWSGYKPETKGVFIACASIYGNTKKAAEILADKVRALGEEKVVVSDLSREDMAECVEDAFRHDRLVLATTTYNADIFPKMKEFILSIHSKICVPFRMMRHTAPNLISIRKSISGFN